MQVVNRAKFKVKLIELILLIRLYVICMCANPINTLITDRVLFRTVIFLIKIKANSKQAIGIQRNPIPIKFISNLCDTCSEVKKRQINRTPKIKLRTAKDIFIFFIFIKLRALEDSNLRPPAQKEGTLSRKHNEFNKE